jgi:phosphoglycolate phosphatase
MKARHAWLFDLDGTLADTAPDLIAALNRMRVARDLAPLPETQLRPQASNGARGLLLHGLDLTHTHNEFEASRKEFLELYAANICQRTRLFPDVSHVLGQLEAADIAWGIVTNKPIALARPLVEALQLRPAVLLGGDSGTRSKPAPDLLWLAAAHLGLSTSRCRYLGDAPRDIESGRAAGMQTIACGWGYIEPDDDSSNWGADLYAREVRELQTLIPKR